MLVCVAIGFAIYKKEEIKEFINKRLNGWK